MTEKKPSVEELFAIEISGPCHIFPTAGFGNPEFSFCGVPRREQVTHGAARLSKDINDCHCQRPICQECKTIGLSRAQTPRRE